MTMKTTRRGFMRMMGLAGGGLALGISIGPGCAGSQVRKMTELAAKTGEFQPNFFLTVTPDDKVVLAVGKSEMGQGALMMQATLVAEELEVPLEQVDAQHAAKPEFETSVGEASVDGGGAAGMQITGGSSSTPETFLPLRRAASSAKVMLIGAAAARWNVPASECVAEAGQVRHAGSGKSARYGELTKEAAMLPIAAPKLKARDQFRVIGKRSQRVDAADKSTGRAVFGIDVKIPNALYAYVIHPPVMGAQAKRIDDAEAKRARGVVAVLPFKRGVAVVAERFWQAQRAAKTVRVEWSGGLLDGLNTDDMRNAALKRVHTRSATNVVREEGDVEAGMKASGVKTVDATYDVPFLAHAPMEPLNCAAHVKPDGTLELWVGTQSPTISTNTAAKILGIDRSDVTIHLPLLGGGFGRRASPDFVAEAVLLAKRFDRPVHVIWTRDDDTRQAHYRPLAVARMQGAVDSDGRVRAFEYHGASVPILPNIVDSADATFPGWMPGVAKRMLTRAGAGFLASGTVPDFLALEGVQDTRYALDAFRFGFTPIRTKVLTSFWRSVGHSFNGFFMESFVDELAHAAGKDPVEFRRALLADSPRDLRVLNEAAKLGRWGEPLEPGYGRGVAVHRSFHTYCAQVIEAGVFDGEVRVRRVACAVDCGTIVNPDVVMAQMEGGIVFGLSAALKQAIDIEDGQVVQGNFDTYPLLRLHETPEIEVTLIDSDAKPTGVGEPGLPPVAAALANALFASTGMRLRRLPLDRALRDAANTRARKRAATTTKEG